MRVFKFRAFDPEARKMIYKPETLRRVLYYEKDNGFHMGRVKSKTNGDWVSFPIMQWTGLFDKTGNHIWESDIIMFLDRDWFDFEKDTKRLPVVYEGDAFVLKDNKPNRYGEFGTYPLFKDYGRDRFEVIGNIHENPELL